MERVQSVRRYRDLAAEAIEVAERASEMTIRATYLRIAAGWHQLAQEAENAAALPKRG